MNNQDKKRLNKISLYVDESLRERIDQSYRNYCDQVRSRTELQARPLSLSAWLTLIIRKSECIRSVAS